MANQKTRTEPFTNVDAAWLHMERPTSMAMITSVMFFDELIDFKRLQETVETGMLCYPRFKMRVVEPTLPLGLPHWETDRHFSLSAHLHRIALPAPGDQAALQHLVGDLMSTPLDFSKPLWQIHLVENFNGGCAVVTRLHHCIADGLALMQVLLNMAEQDPQTLPKADCEEPQKGWDPLGFFRPAAKLVRGAYRTAGTLMQEGWATVAHPSRLIDAAKIGASGGLALSKLLLTSPDTPTILKGAGSVEKRAAWSTKISLADVKAIGKRMGGTVNDVLLTAVAGGLRRYLEGRGEPVDGVEIRAMVPVNLRGPGELSTLGNRFGLVFLSLPVGIQDPLRRLMTLKRRMDEIKNTPEAVVAFGLLNVMGMTPKQIEEVLLKFFANKATAVMTNVPGPREVLYYAGQRIRGLSFWVPHPGDLGLGVSVISQAGEITVGVASDACLVPDPQTIVEGFHAELEQMRGWGRSPELEAAASTFAGMAAQVEALAAAIEVAAVETQTSQPEAAPTAGEPLVVAPPNGRCQAHTKSGAPCKNPAAPGSPLCRVHRLNAEP